MKLNLDKKGEKSTNPYCLSPIPLISSLFKEQQDENYENYENDLQKELEPFPELADLVQCQLLYFKGYFEEAQKSALTLSSKNKNPQIRMGCAFVIALCSLCSSDVHFWGTAIDMLETIEFENEQQKCTCEMIKIYLSGGLYVTGSAPEWLAHGRLDNVDADVLPFARVAYLKLLLLGGDNIKTLAVAEPMIYECRRDNAVLAEIYARLMAASAYHESGDDAFAIIHLDIALKKGIPLNLIAPFAEYRRSLGQLLDKQLKDEEPLISQKIKQLSKQLLAGWTKRHNQILSAQIFTELTEREYEAAKYAAQNMTNIEIADHMNIAENSVKYYLKNVYSKLHITKRSALKDISIW